MASGEHPFRSDGAAKVADDALRRVLPAPVPPVVPEKRHIAGSCFPRLSDGQCAPGVRAVERLGLLQAWWAPAKRKATVGGQGKHPVCRKYTVGISDVVTSSPGNLAGDRHTLDSSPERLLPNIREGSRTTVDALFERYRSWLRRWARGRLPAWVRGAIDTSDLVQDALHRTFERLERFEPKHANALRIYLRRAVENQIRDELRRAVRRRAVIAPDEVVRLSDDGAPQHRQLVDDEIWRRYLSSLKRLTPRERRLIVGHAELEYSYRQLALIEGMPSPDAARMALRRAVIRLSSLIGNP